MIHRQTPAEHARQKAWVLLSEALEAPTDRHGTYRNRRKALPPVLPSPVLTTHIYVLPQVREL